MNPKFPVYVVSKGRWDSRLTVKALEMMRVPFHLIVEKDEYENYCKVVDSSKILITPQKYNDEYDTFGMMMIRELDRVRLGTLHGNILLSKDTLIIGFLTTIWMRFTGSIVM